LLGSSAASRSMVLMLGKSMYRDDDKSAAPSIDAAPMTREGLGHR
jgi:hypothetical protein